METKLDILRRYFGYTSFRRGQEEIVDALLTGRDALCVMPTGAGKSVCYQVPALLLPGITLVISPLISLMKDQVESLTQAGVHAAYLNSSLTPAQYSRALHNLSEGLYKLVYVAPERLSTENFRTAVEDLNISLIAVDEAHCVSQWGQDFRPDYLKIAEFAESLKNRPTIGAFTATATKAVRKDIAEHLHLIDPVRITTGFDRPNLYFGVQTPHSKALALLKLIEVKKPMLTQIIDRLRHLLQVMNLRPTLITATLSFAQFCFNVNQKTVLFWRKNIPVSALNKLLLAGDDCPNIHHRVNPCGWIS